jgi:SRSO17 transposase
MSEQERKSVEPIALHFARGPHGAAATQKEVVALQGFLTDSPWEAGDVFREIQAVFAEELVPTATQWPLGTVGVFDESGFEKAGTESVVHESHRKTWLAKHKQLAGRLLL